VLSLYRIKNVIIMSDKKTMNEELGMEYSPILGVTYGLVNVTPEEDQGPEYDSAGFSIEDREG
jgi:hypothetical protein